MKVSGQLHYSSALPPGMNVPLPIECTTSYSIWPSGRFGYEKNISFLNSDQDSLCIKEMSWRCGVASGLQAGRSGGPIQAEATDFLFSTTVQTWSGAHPAPYPMVTNVISRRLNLSNHFHLVSRLISGPEPLFLLYFQWFWPDVPPLKHKKVLCHMYLMCAPIWSS